MRKICGLVALLAVAAAPIAVQAGMSPPASGPAPLTSPEEQASDAGTAAGLAASCGTDPTPVRAAFTLYLDRRHSSAGERQRLWQHLSLTERSTIDSFGKSASGCATVQAIVLKAVHRLEGARG
jgi:hypothetical protein